MPQPDIPTLPRSGGRQRATRAINQYAPPSRCLLGARVARTDRVQYRPEGSAMAAPRQGPIERRRADTLPAGVGRREFIALLGGSAVAWPLAVQAQPSKKVPTIGVLTMGTSTGRPLLAVDVFLQALRDLGWIEGKNVRVEMRVAPTVDRLPELAAELVRMNVDVIFASSSTFVEAPDRRPKRFRLYSLRITIQSGSAMWRAWRTLVGTSRGCLNFKPSLLPSSWRC